LHPIFYFEIFYLVYQVIKGKRYQSRVETVFVKYNTTRGDFSMADDDWGDYH